MKIDLHCRCVVLFGYCRLYSDEVELSDSMAHYGLRYLVACWCSLWVRVTSLCSRKTTDIVLRRPGHQLLSQKTNVCLHCLGRKYCEIMVILNKASLPHTLLLRYCYRQCVTYGLAVASSISTAMSVCRATLFIAAVSHRYEITRNIDDENDMCNYARYYKLMLMKNLSHTILSSIGTLPRGSTVYWSITIPIESTIQYKQRVCR